MSRWEPDAVGRLRRAAIELFTEQGYEQTTVADIAQRAGLTARTFFRYFTDKREVLFAGSAELAEQLDNAVGQAPTAATPLDVVALVLDAAARELGHHREYSRRRQDVISANAQLRERELIKMASLAQTLTAGLQGRGVTQADAALAAEVGIGILRVSFDRWVSEPAGLELAELMHDSLDRVRALTAAS